MERLPKCYGYPAASGHRFILGVVAIIYLGLFPSPALSEISGSLAKGSFFSRLWELDEETRRDEYAIKPYRSNYVLPFTYNDSPNDAPIREADPNKKLKKPEVKFQLSLKVKLWQDIFGKEMDLWFGYTQQSFWQFYNFEDSSPFRESNYEPELLLNFRTHFSILGWKGRFINVGFNHQSN
ncbi:MAG: phospholipase A, partial [Deltaproteobacteria bacterium]|nr:phospholipase A [Deltaproteobacteria bacterium]